MKLVIANNQTEQFRAFHDEVQRAEKIYDYIDYRTLLFYFEKGVSRFINVENGQSNDYYDGVYLNGYLATTELAITMAQVLWHNKINHVNLELDDAPSFTKLSAYARLAARNVSIPRTFGGSAHALLKGIQQEYITLEYPLILKRADADRGIDNFKLESKERAVEILSDSDADALWVMQDFIPNDGFFLVSYYNGKPKFSIFRALEERPNRRPERRHMYKPPSGINATLLDPNDIPAAVAHEAYAAATAVRRQIASVDLLYTPDTETAYVLEVNYNPQLVTINTYKEIRIQTFLDAIRDM